MACNCNSSNCKSTPCACKDTGLKTPCAYTECVGATEKCAECICMECITHCEDTFQVTNAAGDIFTAAKGERLTAILQRIALYMAAPACVIHAIQ